MTIIGASSTKHWRRRALRHRSRMPVDAHHEIEALIDTGFNGSLTFTVRTEFIRLGLPWLYRQQGRVRRREDSRLFDVYPATIFWRDARPCQLRLKPLMREPLIGMGVLQRLLARSRCDHKRTSDHRQIVQALNCDWR